MVDNGNGTYTITVDLGALANGDPLALHYSGGQSSAVAFNLPGVTGIVTTSVATDLSTPVHMDGFGNFAAGVGCTTTTGANVCSPSGNPNATTDGTKGDFVFTVNAPSFGLPLLANSGGFHVALDVMALSASELVNGSCPASISNHCVVATGFVGDGNVTVPGPIAGAGLPGLVLASGGLLALSRRRRKKNYCGSLK